MPTWFVNFFRKSTPKGAVILVGSPEAIFPVYLMLIKHEVRVVITSSEKPTKEYRDSLDVRANLYSNNDVEELFEKAKSYGKNIVSAIIFISPIIHLPTVPTLASMLEYEEKVRNGILLPIINLGFGAIDLRQKTKIRFICCMGSSEIFNIKWLIKILKKGGLEVLHTESAISAEEIMKRL